jgi:hypothetical protein
VATTDMAVRDEEFIQQGQSLIEAAKQVTVSSQEEFEQAAEFGRKISGFIKNVEAFFAPLKKAAKAAHTGLCDREKEILKTPTEADAIVKRTANAWKMEQKRLYDERMAAEQKRINDEAAAKRLQEAQALKAKGDVIAAAKVQAAPIIVPEAQVESTFTKVAGTRNRTKWHFEITDSQLVPDRYWKIDESAIRADVQHDKDKANIPGVRVWSTEETDW